VAFVSVPLAPVHPTPDERGRYFPKREYRDRAFVPWMEAEPRLMEPVLPDEAPITRCAYDAWRQAWTRARRPTPPLDWVSNYFDPSPDDQPLRLRDVAFASLASALAGGWLPAATSLDNFYREQFTSGELPATLDRTTGREPADDRRRNLRGEPVDFAPFLRPQAQAQPLLAWVEWEHYLQNGAAERLAMVCEPLRQHLRFLLESTPSRGRLYAPEGEPSALAWNCQAALSARRLADMAQVLAVALDAQGRAEEAAARRNEQRQLLATARRLAEAVGGDLWDEGGRTFRDLDGPAPGYRPFWPLLAEVASPAQAEAVIATVQDLPAQWAAVGERLLPPGLEEDPTVAVLLTCMALRRHGRSEVAHRLAMAHVRQVARVWESTETFWSRYDVGAERPAPGAQPGLYAAGAVAAIRLVADFCIGLRPYAPAHRLEWDVHTLEYCGYERYRFDGQSVTLRAQGRARPEDPLAVEVLADRPFQLVVRVAGRRRIVDVRGRATLTV